MVGRLAPKAVAGFLKRLATVLCVYTRMTGEQAPRKWVLRSALTAYRQRGLSSAQDVINHARATRAEVSELGIMAAACLEGHLEVAQWLAAHFNLTAADARTHDNFALRHACAEGHLAIAQWLAAAFGLTAADARARDNWALRFACFGGHLAMAQWLVAAFGLTAADARAHDNEALYHACVAGHLATAQWLAEVFGLGAADVGGPKLYLAAACASGYLDVARWLTGRFGLGPADALAGNNRALNHACAGGYLATAQWLVATFGLAPGREAELVAAEYGHLKVVQWLRSLQRQPSCC